MADAISAIHEGFDQRIWILAERHSDVLDTVSTEDLFAAGARAAEAALAPLIWAAAVGERWPTTDVTEFLGVTRQALNKRVSNGTVLGLPGRGTTWFPVWQFDFERREVRPVVGEILGAFRDQLGTVDPLDIASWATTWQPELNVTPAEWLTSGQEPQTIAVLAQRSAAELAR